MASTLARLEVRLPPDLKTQLQGIAKERGVSVSEIGLAALQEFLERRDHPVQHDVVLTVLKQVAAQARQHHAVLEQFIRVFLTVTPDLHDRPEAERRAAAKHGHARWEQFQTLLAQQTEAAYGTQ
jgi:predicted transcriptional regulator